tara:strand:- start:551 stop:769 length:219 start_codon:yes stop_codon:yes gene_type:complete
MASKFEITFLYTYEDTETVEVIADSEDEAQRLAEDERCGPNYAWDHAALMMDDVWEVTETEQDVEKEVVHNG